jgi:hypothetical protein
MYGPEVRAHAADLRRQVWNSEGLNHIVVVTATDAQAAEASRLFARSDVRVVRLSALGALAPRAGLSRLEADAELSFGTTRVRLALSPEQLDAVSRAGSADATALLLRLLITPQGVAAPALALLMPIDNISHLFQSTIQARLIAKQA